MTERKTIMLYTPPTPPAITTTIDPYYDHGVPPIAPPEIGPFDDPEPPEDYVPCRIYDSYDNWLAHIRSAYPYVLTTDPNEPDDDYDEWDEWHNPLVMYGYVGSLM